MNRAKFLSTTRLWAVCVLVLFAFCLAGNIQRAYAETYTTMDSSGNLITSDSLESAIETARTTGRPIALDPGHSDGMSGRDPGAIGPSGLGLCYHDFFCHLTGVPPHLLANSLPHPLE